MHRNLTRSKCLPHLCPICPHSEALANSVHPEKTLQDAASDQGLNCSHTGQLKNIETECEEEGGEEITETKVRVYPGLSYDVMSESITTS